MKKGNFIVIDGTDGSGKATQTKLLVERMRRENLLVETISFPQYGKKSAGPLEEYLSGAYGEADDVGPYAASVLYAVDRFDAAGKIKKWLESGINVIADRYVGSNMGHQGSKIEDAAERQKYFEWNEHFEHEIMGSPKPNLNIVLHIPYQVSLELMSARTAAHGEKHQLKHDIHESNPDHLRRAEVSYLHLVDLYDYFKMIECLESGKLLPPETIHENVWQLINSQLKLD